MEYLHIIVAGLVIIGFIVGIRLMQTPETALWGNRLGAFCMFLALLFTLYFAEILTDFNVWLIILIGGLLGFILGQGVKMIQMPQMVALFNGFGGGASGIIAGLVLTIETNNTEVFFWLTALLALPLGTLTFTGSIVAALKLQGWISQKPVFLRGHSFFLGVLVAAVLILIIAGTAIREASFLNLIPVLVLLAALYGVFMAIRVGGADMPIIIAFFNSLSGIATAICGLVVENLFLAGVGSLVGVAGMILTRIMCGAMNRSLLTVLSGLKNTRDNQESSKKADYFIKAMANQAEGLLAAETEAEEEKSGEDGESAEDSATTEEAGSATQQEGEESPDDIRQEEIATGTSLSPEDKIASLVNEIHKVIIVPGYGMAVAQAQHQVFELIKTLEDQGKEVKIAIHPVAGRMPGHMNVLLAEVGVPYEQLHDIDMINPEFVSTDLVVVVGACDVINPAANTAEGSPIYGMPVLAVDAAKNVIVCNLDENPGYSGVENLLYVDEKVIALWGNAAETVPRITAIFKENSNKE